MGLIQCPECGKMVSERAVACPECGCPVGDPLRQVSEPYSKVAPSGNPSAKILFGFLAGVIAILAFSVGSYVFGLIMGIIALFEFGQAFAQPNNNGSQQGYQQYQQPQLQQDKKLRCLNCGGYNINVSVSTVNQVIGSTREVREKDKITRTANHLGRGFMNVMTLGMWSLTPKRSDYKETERVRSRNIQYKTAVCQTCGYSWNL